MQDTVAGRTAARSGFFKTAFGPARGLICLWFRTADSTGRHFHRYYTYPDNLEQALDDVEAHYEKFDVYYCPQLLTTNKLNKQNIESCPTAWSDLDTCEPESLLLKPSVLVESSPGRYQAVWRFESPVAPAEGERVSKRIAYGHAHEGADKSGWDLSQLLRVPWTYNHKYKSDLGSPMVKVIGSADGFYRPKDFDVYPEVLLERSEGIPYPEELPKVSPGDILEKYRSRIQGNVWELFSSTPIGDWSETLWKLMRLCFESGMEREEVFIVAEQSACNKFARDGKGSEALWRDVCRAWAEQERQNNPIVMPDELEDILTSEERSRIEGVETFVERYIKWASDLGDAATQYHQAGAFIVLSALLAGRVNLPTSFGSILPNLWFMILADTTLTRKAQPLDSKILTPSGWISMGDIQVDSEVIGQNGRPTKVVGISPQTVEDVYRVTFNDGSSTECTADHLWATHQPGGNYATVMPLSRIMCYSLKQGEGRWFRQIPTMHPAYLAGSELPIDPYLLGLLLGDGNLGNGGTKFTSADPELVEAAREALAQYGLGLEPITGTDYNYRVTGGVSGPGNGSHIHKALKALDIRHDRSWDKKVPQAYLDGSVEDRLALLQGLMDTDGWVGKNRSTNFGSSSKQLALDVQYLVRSLGGWSGYDGGHKTKGRDCHQVSVSMPLNINPFRLRRKAERLEGKRAWARPRSMRKIEPVGQKVVQCIKVAAEDGLYVTDDFIVTHNTTAMDIAVDLLCEVEDEPIMATDGSIEGLLQGLSTRPGVPSVFLRDEVSGLLDMIAKKDYYAGMAETLTKLYDGKLQKRVLRKETVEVRDPVLIFFAGGIKVRVQQLLSLDHVSSGFVPRFVFITAESDVSKVRPLGPPTDLDTSGRQDLLTELHDLREYYAQTIEFKPPQGNAVHIPRKWDAELTEDAWARFHKFEHDMLQEGVNSERPDIMTPVFARLTVSTLKAIILLATCRQKKDRVMIELDDVLLGLRYCEQWRGYALEVINGIGKGVMESQLDRVYDNVKRNPGISRSTLMRSYHLTAREADVIFTTLEQRGLVTPTRKGRGVNYFVVR